MSTVYVVATPIGNLQDISLRALEVFKSVDVVVCEDTRVTQKLLAHFAIPTKTIAHHQQSRISDTRKIFEILQAGKNIALVTDAGTPGIQDPGNKLLSELINKFEGTISIVPVPGPSALTALASVSGLPTDSFVFLGYIPKKGTEKIFTEITESVRTVIFYETGHRILKTLEALEKQLSKRQVVVGRELTKKFEHIYRGTCAQVMQELKDTSIKGEFVVVVERL